MADLGTSQNWLVSPNKDVEIKWLKVKIQEKRSRLAGFQRDYQKLEQQIEDIKNGHMLDCEAKCTMCEREIDELTKELKQQEDIIDVNANEGGGESNG